MKVAIITPATSADPFYGNLIAFMRIAADSLGIKLEVIECDRSEERMRQAGSAVAGRRDRPDYLILENDRGAAVEILPLAADAGIKTLLIYQGVLAADRHLIGEPREKHPNWLGELLPDDRANGFLLAETLIQEARTRGKLAGDGKIHICGLAANYTPASLLRIRGLHDAVARHADVSLDELVLADWDAGKAAWWTRELLQRNPETSVIWAASDTMALGAAEAIEAIGQVPGRDVFTGGIDWAPAALEMVRDGVLTASVGGHFMDAAWGVIMLYDYHQGRDFRSLRQKSSNLSITSRNVHEYLHLMDRRHWRAIDFSRLSRVRNPSRDDYELSPTAVFNQILAGRGPVQPKNDFPRFWNEELAETATLEVA